MTNDNHLSEAYPLHDLIEQEVKRLQARNTVLEAEIERQKGLTAGALDRYDSLWKATALPAMRSVVAAARAVLQEHRQHGGSLVTLEQALAKLDRVTQEKRGNDGVTALQGENDKI